MTETSAPTATTPTSRRSPAALKAHYLAKAAEAGMREDLKLKRMLEKLAIQVTLLAAQRTQDPKIGQAASLLTTAAAAIQIKLPQ